MNKDDFLENLNGRMYIVYGVSKANGNAFYERTKCLPSLYVTAIDNTEGEEKIILIDSVRPVPVKLDYIIREGDFMFSNKKIFLHETVYLSDKISGGIRKSIKLVKNQQPFLISFMPDYGALKLGGKDSSCVMEYKLT